MKYYFDALRNYANFRGRATRKEYWMFILFHFIFTWLAVILDFIIAAVAVGVSNAIDVIAQTNVLGAGISHIYIKYFLLLLIPSLSIAVRRMHDIGKSGWTILVSAIPFIGWIWYLVLLCTDSKTVDNPFSTAAEKPAKSTAQLLKTNLITATLLWATNFLFGVVLELVMRNTGSYDQYVTISNIFNIPFLILELFVWGTWVIGMTQLQQSPNQKFKKLFTTAFYIFLAAEVFSTIGLLAQYNYRGPSATLVSKLYLLANIILFASIIVRYLALKQAAQKQQNTISLSLYLFAIPGGIWHLWLLLNVFLLHISGESGSGFSKLLLIIRLLIILAAVAAAILLMQIKIKGQKVSGGIPLNNRGLRLISEEHANTHWTLTYLASSKSSPVLIMRFDHFESLMKALDNISFFHWSETAGEYISSEVIEYGYYRIGESQEAGEFILCGTDLTLEDWQEAKNVLSAAGGTVYKSTEPEIHKKQVSTPVNVSSSIKFKEKRVDGRYTYEVYTGRSKEEALVFLGSKTVTQGLYYIIVETPEGNYGKDVQGVYKE